MLSEILHLLFKVMKPEYLAESDIFYVVFGCQILVMLACIYTALKTLYLKKFEVKFGQFLYGNYAKQVGLLILFLPILMVLVLLLLHKLLSSNLAEDMSSFDLLVIHLFAVCILSYFGLKLVVVFSYSRLKKQNKKVDFLSGK
ncbi:membrane hypothetical protein [Vibrio nigripulchritudo MADA3029]|uniref:hypothetical protein n=1 Tax=Vibrio nigripulchritudo TaxID=28173 RepID=UPI0003B214C9|nr:hypothetical protein [Vibrio nigripulchritudo]CCN46701.1 membrane hypothetical protein [Vibrio nigripulchritudo MADA3020]CCN54522.1 membrane hypothetical protein [Vibrio nigripulchritudo MADA3021]CCN59559.1 membrane hypothetical protein [Vibrio nigripulchritudo MADA3029]